MIKVSIPQVPLPNDLNSNGRAFNIEFFNEFPTLPEYHSMGLKSMDYAQRHEKINFLSKEIFIDFELYNRDRIQWDMYTIDDRWYKLKNNIETVFYWVNKTVSDVVGVLSYTFQVYNKSIKTAKIQIYSLDDLSYCPYQDFIHLFKDYKQFFLTIKQVAHFYGKGCIVSEPKVYASATEPVIVYQKDLGSIQELSTLSLIELLNQYTGFFLEFYPKSQEWMNQWSEAMPK